MCAKKHGNYFGKKIPGAWRVQNPGNFLFGISSLSLWSISKNAANRVPAFYKIPQILKDKFSKIVRICIFKKSWAKNYSKGLANYW